MTLTVTVCLALTSGEAGKTVTVVSFVPSVPVTLEGTVTQPEEPNSKHFFHTALIEK